MKYLMHLRASVIVTTRSILLKVLMDKPHILQSLLAFVGWMIMQQAFEFAIQVFKWFVKG